MSCVVSYVVVGGCVSLRLLCRCVVYIYVVAYVVVVGGFCCVSCFSLCLLFRFVIIYVCKPQNKKYLKKVIWGVFGFCLSYVDYVVVFVSFCYYMFSNPPSTQTNNETNPNNLK